MASRLRHLLLFFLFLIFVTKVNASHMGGADLEYKCIGVDTFKIVLKVYRDCTGIPPNPSPQITLTPISACSTTSSVAVTMTRTSVRPVRFMCPSQKNVCEGGSFPFGLEEHRFEVTVALQQVFSGGLSASCCWIRLAFQECCRNGNITNLSGGNFYTEAEMNRCLNPCNSSPVFFNQPISVACANLPFIFNNVLVDTTNFTDSISFQLTEPLGYTSSPIGFLNGFSKNRPFNFLGFPYDSLPFPAGFHLDAVTGEIGFTPIGQQQPVLAIKVEEWRKISNTYQKIGSQIRDVQFYTYMCPPNATPTVTPTTSVFNVNAGSTLCYALKASDTLITDTTKITEFYSPPGTSFYNVNRTYNYFKNDSAYICWTPPLNAAGTLPFLSYYKASDMNCPVVAFVIRANKIFVGPPSALPRNYINNGNRNYSLRLEVPSGTTGLTCQWKVTNTGNAVFDSTNATTYTTSIVNSHTFAANGRYVVRIQYSYASVNYTYFDTIKVCGFNVVLPNDTLVCPDISITISHTRVGGTAPFKYQWNTGTNDTLASITKQVTQNTWYKLTLTDSTTCSLSDSILVRTRPRIPLYLGADRLVCFNDSALLKATVYNSTYLWNDSATVSYRYIKNSGTYWVRVIDTLGCIARDTVVLTKTTQTHTFNAGPDTSICIRDSVQIGNFAVSSNTITYSWSPASGLNSTVVAKPKASPATTTSYYVSAIDSNNCRIKDTVVVTVKPYININLGIDRKFCFYDSIVLDGGNGAASYFWQNSSTNRYFTAYNSGTYYVRNTHPTSGCIFTDTVVLNKTVSFTLNAGPDTSFCAGDSIIIGATASGIPPFSYTWAPATGVKNPAFAITKISPPSTITYGVTAKDSNNCSITDSIKVTVKSATGLNLGFDRKFCFNDSVRLDGGALATSYLWQNNSTSRYFTVYNSGTYFCRSSSANCTSIDTVVLTKTQSFTYNAGANQGICTGDSVAIGAYASGLGPFNYRWSPKAGLNDSTLAIPKASPSSNTNYICTVTDSNTCSLKDTVTVSTSLGNGLNLGPDRTFCFYDSVRLDGGSTATSYLWQNSSTGRYFTVYNTGTYSCRSSNGICTQYDTVVLTKSLPFSINAGIDKTICKGDSVTIGNTAAGTGSYNYRWSPRAGLNDSTLATPKASPSVTTTYYVTVTDANGCIQRDTLTINVFKPFASAGPDKTICAGSSVQIGDTAYGRNPLTIRWRPSTALSDSTVIKPFASPINTTSYVLAVKDSGGCYSYDTLLVTANQVPVVNAGNDTVLCTGDTLQIIATVNSSFSYTFSWSPTTNLINFTSLSPKAAPTTTTNYILTASNSFGCTSKDTMSITVKQLPVLNFSQLHFSCFGDSVIIGDSASGNKPISYLWTPGAYLSDSTSAITKAAPSVTLTYNLRAKDVFGCITNRSVTVNAGTFFANAGPDTAICKGQSVTIGVAPSGPGSSNTIYNWQPNYKISSTINFTPIVTPDTTTYYVLKATNSLLPNCTKYDTVKITIRSKPIPNAGSDQSMCYDDTVTINGSINANGAKPPITFNWSPTIYLTNTNTLTPKAVVQTTRTYYLTATDSFGCSSKDTVVVYWHNKPIPDAGLDKYKCSSNQQVNLTVSGGSDFKWSLLSNPDSVFFQGSSLTVSPNQYTRYLVKVSNPSDGKTCFNYDTVDVYVNILPPITIQNDTLTSCINQSALDLNLANPNPTGGYWSTNILWQKNCFDTTTGFVNPSCLGYANSPAIYTYKVGGCSVTDTITIIVNMFSPVNAGPDLTLCNNTPAFRLNTSPAYTKGVSWVIIPPCNNCLTGNTNNPFFTARQTSGINHKLITSYVNVEGCTNTDTVSLKIAPPFIADFTASVTSGTAPLQVNFTNNSSLTNGFWFWDFGDSTQGGANFSNLKNPSRWYTKVGKYTVQLIAHDTTLGINCFDTLTKTNFVTVNPSLYSGSPAFTPVQVFPNPTHNYVTVQCAHQGKYLIELFDYTGKLVLKETFTGTKSDLNIGAHAKGIYMMVITNENEERTAFKLLKE